MKKKYGYEDMGRKELEKLLEDKLKELREVRFDFVLSAVDDPNVKKYLKRDVARIKTMIREMDLGIRTEENKYVGVKGAGQTS